MDTDMQNIFRTLRRVGLSPAEKKSVRAGVALFMEQHPVRNIALARQRIEERSKSAHSAYAEVSALQSLLSRLQPMFIALLIALVVGGGTSFAAESALPGDALYPVKVSINEEVGSFLAFSEEAQARFDTRRAEKRLEEAEQLTIKGRLDSETSASIESRFAAHAEALEEDAQAIAAKNDSRAAFEVHSNFEASLSAHERILAQLALKETDVRAVLEPLLLSVRTRLQTTARARSSAEADIRAKTNGEFKTAAEGKLGAAENKLREVRGFIERKKASVSADAHAKAEARLRAATEVIARGKTEMEAQTYGSAFASFEEASRIAQEAKLLLAAEERIGIEIDVPGIGIDLKIGDDRAVEGAVRLDGDERAETRTPQETTSTTSIEIESRTKGRSGTGATDVEGEGTIKIDIGL